MVKSPLGLVGSYSTSPALEMSPFLSAVSRESKVMEKRSALSAPEAV
jgi:hypothetical protein